MSRPPLPPFTADTAAQKDRMVKNWEFDADGLMARRIASINDLAIAEADRKFHWPTGQRPDDHASLSDLGL